MTATPSVKQKHGSIWTCRRGRSETSTIACTFRRAHTCAGKCSGHITSHRFRPSERSGADPDRESWRCHSYPARYPQSPYPNHAREQTIVRTACPLIAVLGLRLALRSTCACPLTNKRLRTNDARFPRTCRLEAGRSRGNMRTKGFPAPRIGGRRSTSWWRTPSDGHSTRWCAGDSIGLVATYDTSSCWWMRCRRSVWPSSAWPKGLMRRLPPGRLQLHVLGAIAEFERARIAERVRAGLVRARAQGKVTRTKNKQRRTVDLSLKLVEALKQLRKDVKVASLKAGQPVSAWVFVTPELAPLDSVDSGRREPRLRAETNGTLEHQSHGRCLTGIWCRRLDSSAVDRLDAVPVLNKRDEDAVPRGALEKT